MSDIAHTTIPLRLRVRSSRPVLIAVTVFLVLGAMIIVLTVSTGSESTDSNLGSALPDASRARAEAGTERLELASS